MPFSSVLGASSVIKPGVCTSSTRPTAPYEGQLIYETDTDRVASWNGSSWVYTATSGMVLLASATLSAATSFTIDNVFSSQYRFYRLMLNSTLNSANITCQLRSSGTTRVNDYNYQYITASGTTVAAVRGTGQASLWMGVFGGGFGALDCLIVNPASAVRTSFISQTIFGASFSDVNVEVMTFAGNHNVQFAYDGIIVSAQNANTLTGAYSLYGLAGA
jgi:hypothetical protein